MAAEDVPVSNFIREIIDRDLADGKHASIVTRFPPEPNGYLHIGHAKSICLNFGLARDYNGQCNLRFDDTNPSAEDVEYVDSIIEDVRWLGFDWGKNLFFASDYFEQMVAYAEDMIRNGKAYVCTLTPEEFKEYRGVPTRPGLPSPWRDRPVEENLDLFRRMRAGEFADGQYVLRCCAPRLIWHRQTCTCAIPRSTASSTRITTVPGTAGAFTRCMISPMGWKMRSRASRIRSVPWSSRFTVRFTIGCWISSMCLAIRNRLNSPGST